MIPAFRIIGSLPIVPVGPHPRSFCSIGWTEPELIGQSWFIPSRTKMINLSSDDHAKVFGGNAVRLFGFHA